MKDRLIVDFRDGLIIVVCLCLFTALVYFVWNDLVAAFTDVRLITAWQAFLVAIVLVVITEVLRR